MARPTLSGALLLDKPSGTTSARALDPVKRLLPRRTKVGHAGTLDPMASGLLVVLVGRATRLSRYVMDLPKTYLATARFGATSDTLDADGEIVEIEGATLPPEAEIRASLPGFTGEILQTPPMVSALKVGGERLYDLHRRGISVEREPRRVRVERFELISFDPRRDEATFSITCGSGTYVRSLVSDLAASLGSAAYLTSLRRLSTGHLHVKDALPPEALDAESVYKRIIHPRRLLEHLPAREVDEGEAVAVCNGRTMRWGEPRGSFRVERGGRLLAVYRG
ncbi:tRNA pseudouridine(55) synthase TruB, partial [Rubrobacter naiadicus]|uniref:tRNA pseudouridine(55) synthase TruB n=1 Tax=Rubrobacter naiadicus TaxID=1392641 RepID=UPI0030811971